MNRAQRRLMALFGGGLIVALAWFLFQRSGDKTPPAPPVAQSNDPLIPPELQGKIEIIPPSALKASAIDAGTSQLKERFQRALDDYLEFAKYPPWSRPADDSQKHVLE